MRPLSEIQVTTIDGQTRPLGDFLGKATLVVNVASKCGFTPQYKGLEALYRANKDKGLVVLGFPCDQFGHQEPGDEAEIQSFCSLNYDVTFPMFAKVDVNGAGAHPLYQALKQAAPGLLGSEGVKWNFTKFLLDGQGRVVDRFAPVTRPESLQGAIDKLIA
ncbi:glutathione peroxidase [Aquabacterium olei]|uniref:Glutathione peroxidase n=1 Tax=Aquabacterium olei TaxID=1296669 RepID=A0A2U8FU43_9BURK|nr:glutathione peroxidase [Aquabacterium olei]AWI54575.1 glutathione peroxidase [Aquabacterium olei]